MSTDAPVDDIDDNNNYKEETLFSADRYIPNKIQKCSSLNNGKLKKQNFFAKKEWKINQLSVSNCIAILQAFFKGF